MKPKDKGLRKRAAGYLRVSTYHDGKQAPEHYRDAINRYVDANDHLLVETFEDLDFSGRDQNRPAFQELLGRRKEFDLIVVPRLSRFGRNMRQNLEIYDLLEEEGIGLVCIDLGVDTTTASGRFARNMFTAMAEFESDRLGEQWKATHRYLKNAGRPIGGTNTPYGFRYDKSEGVQTYFVHKAEAKVVREVFDRFLRNESLRSIVTGFNERKVPTGQRGAKKWSHSTIGNMLENPAYAGLAVDPDGNLIAATWEEIVSKETWERARDLRTVDKDRVRQTRKPRQGSGQYLLSGIVVCGACGKNLHHRPAAGHRPEIYACPDMARGEGSCKGGSVDATRAERMVAEAYLQRLVSPEAQALLHREEILEPDVDDLDTRLDEIDRQMERLVTLAIASESPLAQQTFQRKSIQLEESREALLAQRRAATSEAAQSEVRVTEMRRFLGDLARHVPELWADNSLSPEALDRYEDVLALHSREIGEQRQILSTLIERVETVPGTRPKKVKVVWR